MAGINKGKGIAMAMPYRRLRCYKFIKEKKSGYQKVYLLTFPLIPPSPSFFLKNFVQKVQAKACNPVGLVVLLTWKSGYQKVHVLIIPGRKEAVTGGEYLRKPGFGRGI